MNPYHQPPDGYRPPQYCEQCLGHIVCMPVVSGYGWRHLTRPPAEHDVAMRPEGWFDPNTGQTRHEVTVSTWQPGDPVYQRPPDHVACACGLQVLGYGVDLPTVCPECGGPLTDPGLERVLESIARAADLGETA